MLERDQLSIGRVRVTLTFELEIKDADDWWDDGQPRTLDQAAENLAKWYEDGTASIVEDLCGDPLGASTKVEVVRDV